MSWTSSEFVHVLSFLLPGFVAAWVFHGLTPYPKPPQFERLVHALILTAIVNAAAFVGRTLSPGYAWSDQSSLALAVGLAFLIGAVFAFVANRDFAHRLLRRLGVTTENSFPSEWYSAFSRHTSYVVLHLSGQRRLYGWPEEWPSSPGRGHFLMVEPEWLDDDGRIKLENVETVVVPVSSVEMVEFMERRFVSDQETTNGKTTITPTRTADQAS